MKTFVYFLSLPLCHILVLFWIDFLFYYIFKLVITDIKKAIDFYIIIRNETTFWSVLLEYLFQQDMQIVFWISEALNI